VDGYNIKSILHGSAL